MSRFTTRRIPWTAASVASLIVATFTPVGRPAHAILPGPAARASIPAGCAGRALSSRFVAGTLTCASAQGLVVTPAGVAGAAAVAVPLAASTQVCRASHGCQAMWRDLRPGDYLDVSMTPGPAGRPVARWVDANMVTGDGTIRARAARGLTLAIMGRGGAARQTRLLLIAPSTLVTMIGGRTRAGATGGLRVGDTIYFTASADSARLLTARLWAIRIIQTR